MSAERRIRKAAKTLLDEAPGSTLTRAYIDAYGYAPRSSELQTFTAVLRALKEIKDDDIPSAAEGSEPLR